MEGKPLPPFAGGLRIGKAAFTSRKWRENTSPVLFVHFRLANIPKHSSAARISYDSLLGSFLTPSGEGVPNHEIDYVEFEFDLPTDAKTAAHMTKVRHWVEDLQAGETK